MTRSKVESYFEEREGEGLRIFGCLDLKNHRILSKLQQSHIQGDMSLHNSRSLTINVGNMWEHVVRFLDSVVANANDSNLFLRELSKSLTNRAYTWMWIFKPWSMHDWEHLVSLVNTDYYDPVREDVLVNLGIHKMIEDYRIYLENLSFLPSWKLRGEPMSPCKRPWYPARRSNLRPGKVYDRAIEKSKGNKDSNSKKMSYNKRETRCFPVLPPLFCRLKRL